MARTITSRRGFLGIAAAAVMVAPAMLMAEDRQGPGVEALHRPLLRVPAATSSGARVPITVEMTHPMEPDHYVTALEVVNLHDPVPVKGVFQFTPANGLACVAFQARVDEGQSAVTATAHCGRHGRFTASAPITVAAGGGGCAGGAPPAPRLEADEIRPPVIRIPRLVAEEQIRRGESRDADDGRRHRRSGQDQAPQSNGARLS